MDKVFKIIFGREISHQSTILVINSEILNIMEGYRQVLMSSKLQFWSFHVIIWLLCVNRTETSSEGGACSNIPLY